MGACASRWALRDPRALSCRAPPPRLPGPDAGTLVCREVVAPGNFLAPAQAADEWPGAAASSQDGGVWDPTLFPGSGEEGHTAPLSPLLRKSPSLTWEGSGWENYPLSCPTRPSIPNKKLV